MNALNAKDICSTFEIDASFLYWFCTMTKKTFNTYNPYVMLTNRSDFTYVRTILFNWG